MRLVALIGLVGVALALSTPARADRNALWNIISGQCAPHAAAGEAPKPCLVYDAPAGVTILKDREGVAQLLDMPATKVTGIEDPAVLAPGAPNYFVYAWATRGDMDAFLGHAVPREDVGIAVNSMLARSQDQLHLHVDCLDKDVPPALAAYAASLDDTFRPMTVALKGRKYWARRLDEADLAKTSPFQLLADGIVGARQEMGLWSLALVGVNFPDKPGFALLADHVELTEGGHSEDLQDHSCAISPKS